ncbi:MAG TPA: hybrid sensor histidine kinase/response regulator [Acidimicrobiales bacterium]|nr:hybrid sensor histidine kinase/response regulator [Acidimicrobiales bacterium]
MSKLGDFEEEFRQLFAEEAETRLLRLSTELLQLEEAGNDPELVASIFRDAHTLKGAAGMVGLDPVARVAHVMEDLLEELRQGERMASPRLVDGLLAAVDAVRRFIPELMAGEDRTDEAAVVEANVRALREEPVEEPPVPSTAPATAPPPPSAAPPIATPAPRSDQSGETIRVPVPRLDQLVRLVGEAAAAHLRMGRMLTDLVGTDPANVAEFRELSHVLNELQEKTMRARMVPVATITDNLHRAVRDVARSCGKDVHWEVRGDDTELDRSVLEQLADPLLHLVRNAVDHGIETAAEREAAGKPAQATVRLHAMQLGSEVILAVSDDGGGIDVGRVRDEASRRGADTTALSDEETLYLIFRSGLSTAEFISDVSGRGVGLDVVRTAVDATRGRIDVRSTPGEGTEFRIVVPITLAVLPCLLVEAGGRCYALPLHSVLVAQDAEHAPLRHAEGRLSVQVGSQAVPVSDLGAVLGADEPAEGPVVVVSGVTRRHAFRVDRLVGQRDVVVKGLGRLLPRLDVLAGASVEPDGSILVVLDAPGLIDRARSRRERPSTSGPALSTPRRGTILVVDDAMTVRELQRSILERAGYAVRTADDGVSALARLAEEPADLVMTDVEMPRMDGFALTEAIRAQPSTATIPVLILTSRAGDEDRQRGLEAGADGYIVKSAFDESGLLAAVERLLGRAS